MSAQDMETTFRHELWSSMNDLKNGSKRLHDLIRMIDKLGQSRDDLNTLASELDKVVTTFERMTSTL